MVRKVRSSSCGTYWSGKYRVKLSWQSGRRRRGQAQLRRERRRRRGRRALPEPCLPSAVAARPHASPRPASYILSSGGSQVDAAEPRVPTPSWALPRKYRTRSSGLELWIRRCSRANQTRRRERARPVLCPHGLFVCVLPALRLAPAARARELALCFSSAGCAGGGQRRPSPAAGSSRRGCQPPEGAGARGGAERAAVAGAGAGTGARGRGRHVPAAGAVKPGLRLLPGNSQGHPRSPRRQCATVRVHPAADLEADAGGQHPVRELLPAQVRGAVGGGEVRGREAGQGAGGGVAAHPPHQQAQRHDRRHRQPREADRLPGALRHRQHLRLRRARRHQHRKDRRPNLLQLRAGDSTGPDRFSQSGQGHRQGKHGGALRCKRQRQAVVVVGEGSQGHSGLISSMIRAMNLVRW